MHRVLLISLSFFLSRLPLSPSIAHRAPTVRRKLQSSFEQPASTIPPETNGQKPMEGLFKEVAPSFQCPREHISPPRNPTEASLDGLASDAGAGKSLCYGRCILEKNQALGARGCQRGHSSGNFLSLAAAALQEPSRNRRKLRHSDPTDIVSRSKLETIWEEDEKKDKRDSGVAMNDSDSSLG
ncbi:hypothetical protein FPQ18DRAFT_303157 [Pyronema domesticum]|nr:hypothetical protein FPQ18DRAFT_303157 [Pyronema domesticum]